jgi:hypothetical protein
MKRIFKAIQALAVIIKNPWLLNKILDEDNKWQKHVSKKYSGFKGGLPVVLPEALFGDFEETVFPYASLDGSSLPTDLVLLKKLARSFEHCSYFEVGTWRGESVANVAAVASECYTLNLSADQMRQKGLDEKYIQLHRHFSSSIGNVTHLEGDSREFDFHNLGRKFDLVFIDGDHHYELVKNDTKKIFEFLLHEKSIVVWHDYAYNPESIRYEVLAGILDGSPQDYHSSIYHIANTMCAVFFNRDLDSRPFESPQIPAGAFEIKVTRRNNN